MDKILGYIKTVFGKAAEVIDAAVPAGQGHRTQRAVIVALAVKAIPAVLPLIPPPYGPIIAMALPVVSEQILPALITLFAIAHVGRK